MYKVFRRITYEQTFHLVEWKKKRKKCYKTNTKWSSFVWLFCFITYDHDTNIQFKGGINIYNNSSFHHSIHFIPCKYFTFVALIYCLCFKSSTASVFKSRRNNKKKAKNFAHQNVIEITSWFPSLTHNYNYLSNVKVENEKNILFWFAFFESIKGREEYSKVKYAFMFWRSISGWHTCQPTKRHWTCLLLMHARFQKSTKRNR